MNKTQVSDTQEVTSDDMRPEYRFDYRKARPNRFAGRSKEKRLVVVLEPDVAQVFKTPESVNQVLRALIMTMPQIPKQRVSVE